MKPQDKWRMPAEWEPQEATWLTWPANPNTWPHTRNEIEDFFVEFTRVIARFQPVRIIAEHHHHPHIKGKLNNIPDVELVPLPTNDAWCRDHGPTFVVCDSANTIQLGAVDWRYNAWGGKFPPWDSDDALPRGVAGLLGIECLHAPFFCEGGAIEVDGTGNLLTTESVLLNKNRNGKEDRAKMESFFAEHLGTGSVIWLPDGLAGDDTDGHIDMIARFAPNKVLLAASALPDNRNDNTLEANRKLLAEALPDHTILDLPLARDCGGIGSYTNYVVVNGAVIVPTYGDRKADELAAETLAQAFPGYTVEKLDATAPLIEGGSLHCLTQNQPAIS